MEKQPDINSSLEDNELNIDDLEPNETPLEDSFDDDLSERLNGEEKVLHNHLECVKQEAYLITVEGELITKLEHAMLNEESYDMTGYLTTAEQIAKEKLQMYSELLAKINWFKERFEP